MSCVRVSDESCWAGRFSLATTIGLINANSQISTARANAIKALTEVGSGLKILKKVAICGSPPCKRCLFCPRPIRQSRARNVPAYPLGPATVNSNVPDSILPSSVQIAPVASQSVAAGSTMVTVPSSSAMPGVSAIKVRPACAVPSDQAASFNMRARDPMNANPLLFSFGTVRWCRSLCRRPWSR